MNFETYHLSGGASMVTGAVPGPGSLKLLEKQANLEGNNRSYPQGIPLAFERALGSIIEDVDGNRYLDFFAGCGVLNVGHNNPEIMAAVEKQQKKLIHSLDFPTPIKIELMETWDAALPMELQGGCA